MDSFLAELEEQIKKLGIKITNKSCIFVASDNQKNRQYIENTLNKKYNVKVFDLNLKQVERDSVKGLQDALTEWLLLGSMDYLFGSNGSTFSDEAGRLTTFGRKISIGTLAFPNHINRLDPL